MEKTLTLSNGAELKLKTNAGIVRRYRSMYGRNITTDMAKIETCFADIQKSAQQAVDSHLEELGIDKGTPEYENAVGNMQLQYYSDLPVEILELFEDLAYCMAKYADPTQPDTIEEWLDQFETLDIYEVYPELLMLWGADNQTTTSAKKK